MEDNEAVKCGVHESFVKNHRLKVHERYDHCTCTQHPLNQRGGGGAGGK